MGGWWRNRPSVLGRAAEARFKPNVFVQVLIFVATLFILGGVNYGLWYSLFPGYKDNILFDLYILLPLIFWYILYVRFAEGRSLYSMGFTRTGALSKYLTGLVVGVGMMLAVLGICIVTGSMNYSGMPITGSLWMFLAVFGGFLIQGMSEEVMLRGYFMVSVANRAPVAVAIGLSAVIFSFLHFTGQFLLLAFFNLLLYGIFAGLYFLRTDSIWGIAAMHSSWNFMQGNVLGLKVSGHDAGATVFQFNYDSNIS